MPAPEPLAWHVGLGLFAVAYLLGSIPFGLILTRLAGLGDVLRRDGDPAVHVPRAPVASASP